MLRIVLTVFAALLLCSCSSSSTQDSVVRESSKSYFRFSISKSEPTSSNIYYVFPTNQTWGSYSVYRVIEPIVDIDSYSEHTIEGTGPDGSGLFMMRIVTDQEQIESYTQIFFLVSGI